MNNDEGVTVNVEYDEHVEYEGTHYFGLISEHDMHDFQVFTFTSEEQWMGFVDDVDSERDAFENMVHGVVHDEYTVVESADE